MLRREWHGDVLWQVPTTRKGTLVRYPCHYSSLLRSLSNEQVLIMNHPAQDSSTTPETTPTVLVVEDEEVVTDLLQDEGYAVRQAADGLQAIDELEVDDVDLVLSDVRMPRLDGPSLARRLRGRGHAIPVVLMSAADVEVDLPGVRFLPKPFDRDHLLHVVGSALGANR
jgi:CheY-like chemotaxis protein